MLNLVWLKSFVTLVQCRGFQSAANHLGIAQPTVTQHIQKLEDHLGVVLVQRGRLGCEPTKAAQALMPFATSMLKLEERARNAVKSTSLRVGASSNIGIYILQPHVRSFMEQGELPDFELVIDSNPVIAEKLGSGELDVAVMEWWHPRPEFRSQPWKKEPMVLIVPPSHPCATKKRITRQQLLEMTLLGGEPGTGTGRLLARYFGREGRLPKVSMQLGSTEAVKQAVKAGLGISLVLASAVAEEVRNGSLCAIPVSAPELFKELTIIWPEQSSCPLPVSAFVEHLGQACNRT